MLVFYVSPTSKVKWRRGLFRKTGGSNPRPLVYKACSPTSTLLSIRPRCQASFDRTSGILVSLNFDPTKALVEDELDYKCLMI